MMTYRLLFTALFAPLLISTTKAQSSEPRTLFGKNALAGKSIGLFASPNLGFTKLDGGAATLLNLRGGITLQKRFSVGGYYSKSINDVRASSEATPNVYLDYRSLGGFVEYTLLHNRLVHLSFPLMIGWGEVEFDREDGAANLGEANFFQIEPSAMLEVNVHKYVRFHTGAGYRIVGNMNYRNMNQSDISGFTAYVGFKFGLFR